VEAVRNVVDWCGETFAVSERGPRLVVFVVDANRGAALQHVEAQNADVIGIVCAVVVSAIFIIIVILDLTSIKQSLQLLRNNVCPSDQQPAPP